ncbi:MAG: potassium channel family protein [Planctomycetes bacterium]|nr:potassium channel family protein [Planctomycetota bacterium]
MNYDEELASRKDKGLCCYAHGRKFICDYRATDGTGFCVAHTEKRTPEEEKEFQRLLADRFDTETERLNFCGWKFPANVEFPHLFRTLADFTKAKFAGNADFRNVRFVGSVLLNGVEVNGYVHFGNEPVIGQINLSFAIIYGGVSISSPEVREGINCLGATIQGDVHILSQGLKGEISFKSATIQSGVSLEKCHIAGDLIFDHADIGERKGCWGINLNNVHIKGRLSFRSTVVTGRLSMESIIVDGPVCCEFLTTGKSLHCWNAKFGVRAMNPTSLSFYGARIGDHAGFQGAEFHTDVDFRDAEIKTKLNFKNALFKGRADFEGTVIPPAGIFDPPGEIRVEPGKGMWLYRMAKQVYQNMGRYDEAGDYHYMERCEAWQARNRWWTRHITNLFLKMRRWCHSVLGGRLQKCAKRVSDVFELIVLRGICGYFEKPWRIAGVGGAVIFICGLVYWIFESVGPAPGNPSTLLGAMYFSVVTFTTLGFGDIRPIERYSGKLIAGS